MYTALTLSCLGRLAQLLGRWRWRSSRGCSCWSPRGSSSQGPPAVPLGKSNWGCPPFEGIGQAPCHSMQTTLWASKQAENLMNLDLPNFLTDDGALAAAPAGHQGDLLLEVLCRELAHALAPGWLQHQPCSPQSRNAAWSMERASWSVWHGLLGVVCVVAARIMPHTQSQKLHKSSHEYHNNTQ